MSIATALLQGLAGGFLVVLLLVVIGGGLLLVAIVSRTASGTRGAAGTPEEPERSLFPGRALCAAGLGAAVLGAFFVSVSTNVAGVILGMVGYYLGARVFGVIVIVLSAATLLIGLLVGPAAMPGAYDQETNGVPKSFEPKEK